MEIRQVKQEGRRLMRGEREIHIHTLTSVYTYVHLCDVCARTLSSQLKENREGELGRSVRV